MNPDFPKMAETLHIVGGGCFGTQYVRWLLLARRKGMIQFQKIKAIDLNPYCQLQKEQLEDPQLELVASDWVAYLSSYLVEHFPEENNRDFWVPSPLTPHLIFLSFLKAAEQLLGFVFKEETFSGQPLTPVRIPLQNGSLALSFAEWVCPINCIEPQRCPAIRGPRAWDMKSALQHYFAKDAQSSVHLLQCTHWAHGVGTIAMQDILNEFRHLIAALQSESIHKLIVATSSRCHGIVSQARIIRDAK